ncbi:hypothetical protein V1515DRAFT_618229 [Lipomyces mesembrius]
MAKKLRDNVSRVKASSPLGTTIFVGLRAADLGHQAIEHLGRNSVGLDRVLDPSTSQLQPYYMLVILMSLGSSLKQIVTLIFCHRCIQLFNSLNMMLSVTSRVPPSGTWFDLLCSPSVAIGVGAYLIGILTELISELQRRAFKKNHGILTFSFFFFDFASRGVPVLEQYLTERYGEAYKEVRIRVKYSLFPGIY